MVRLIRSRKFGSGCKVSDGINHHLQFNHHRKFFSMSLLLSTFMIATLLTVWLPKPVMAMDAPVKPSNSVWLQPSSVFTIYLPLILTAPLDFINGDFEQGRNVGWAESTQGQCGSNPCPLVVDEFPSGVAAHSGGWAAWLGGLNNETSKLSQSLNIGSGAGLALSYYHRIESRENSCNFDFGYLVINGSEVSGSRVGLCVDNEAGWQQAIIPLDNYSGNVSFMFVAKTDDSINSNYFIDDVSIILQ